MTTPLAEYLSALDARDVREKAHEKYIQAYTQFADDTATTAKQRQPSSSDKPEPSLAAPIRTGSPKGKEKISSLPHDATPSAGLAQIRAELVSSHKIRSEQESQIASLTTENASLKVTNAEQMKRISQLENANRQLERRVKDRTEEIKGKGQFVEQVQDELLALQLQLTMKERENEKLKEDNEELTRRWMNLKNVEAKAMNEKMEAETKRRR